VKPIYPPPDQEWVDPRSPAKRRAMELAEDYFYYSMSWDAETTAWFKRVIATDGNHETNSS
jgi:hypothetical protein